MAYRDINNIDPRIWPWPCLWRYISYIACSAWLTSSDIYSYCHWLSGDDPLLSQGLSPSVIWSDERSTPVVLTSVNTRTPQLDIQHQTILTSGQDLKIRFLFSMEAQAFSKRIYFIGVSWSSSLLLLFAATENGICWEIKLVQHWWRFISLLKNNLWVGTP